MGNKIWCCVVVAVAYVVSFLIEFGFFSIVYNHLPGNCTRFNLSGGSEDLVLLPNKHVLISSGLFVHGSWSLHSATVPPSGILLLDLNEPSPRPLNLTLEGFTDGNSVAPFYPHGAGHWIEPNGSVYLYVINHLEGFDTVESFEYKPNEKRLIYRKTFRNLLFHNLNNLVLVGPDKFYATVDHYCTNGLLIMIETYLRVAWGYVVYFDGESAMVASEGIKYPNGIAKSNDDRFVFVNELLKGQVVAYTRNEDNTLKRVQALPLQIANDNIFVDPTTGHLWVGIIVDSLKVTDYIKDRTTPVASKCLHISIDPTSELPFNQSLVEEVFSTTGEFEKGLVGAVTGCVYVEGRLLISTIARDMMMCEAPYIMYN